LGVKEGKPFHPKKGKSSYLVGRIRKGSNSRPRGKKDILLGSSEEEVGSKKKKRESRPALR